MPKAIRVNGTEVLSAGAGEWHFEILVRYQKREGLTDEQLDEMIEEGRLEFGHTYLDLPSKSLLFRSDEGRNFYYDSKAKVAENYVGEYAA